MIKIVGSSTSLTVEPAQDQRKNRKTQQSNKQASTP